MDILRISVYQITKKKQKNFIYFIPIMEQLLIIQVILINRKHDVCSCLSQSEELNAKVLSVMTVYEKV